MNFLQQAFEQSLMAVGISRPNPAVGAVVVKDGIVVGKGHTQRPGNAHAEVMALRDAGELARGAAIYVTLEPCCHYGRTPPCTKAIIEAGIAEVYFAHADPNPLVRGKSRSILEEAGIKVYEGREACVKAVAQELWQDSTCDGGCKVLSGDLQNASEPQQEHDGEFLFHEIERFFEAYDYYVRNKATYVELKSAVSQDGYMGVVAEGGLHAPLKITGGAANCWNHELRAMSDAVLVGAGTLLADNPSLNVRYVRGNNPVKVVWAGHHVFTEKEVACLHVFETTSSEKLLCLVYTCVPQPEIQKIAVLTETNKAVEVVELNGSGFAECWKQMLTDMAARGMHRLMVEPGAKLAAEIFESGQWNRLDLWRSTDCSVDEALEKSGLEGLPYPELPETLVAHESFMAVADILTVYYK